MNRSDSVSVLGTWGTARRPGPSTLPARQQPAQARAPRSDAPLSSGALLSHRGPHSRCHRTWPSAGVAKRSHHILSLTRIVLVQETVPPCAGSSPDNPALLS